MYILCVCVCVGHPGGRKVEVRYVDFGNKKILSVSDLRKIKDEFFALPSMVRAQYLICQLIFIFGLRKQYDLHLVLKRTITL